MNPGGGDLGSPSHLLVDLEMKDCSNQADSDSVSSDKSENKNQTTADEVNKYDFENKYRITDKGPFCVFVEHAKKNIGRLFPIRVGHYLQIDDNTAKSIVDIKSVGLNRVKVIVSSYEVANGLVNNPLLKNNELIAYIPTFYTQKKGVVRMVDTEFSEGYLKQAIKSDRQVVEVKRMMRRAINEKGELEQKPRQMIVVSFLGSTIPASVKINGVIFEVEPYYYPVVCCKRCMRYGHSTKLCRSKKVSCRKCSGEHNEEVCTSQAVFCVHCKSTEHRTADRTCPMYVRQRNIKKIMADQNVSFKEAEHIEKNPSYAKIATYNRFSILSNSDFPSLPKSQNNPTGLFNSQSIHPIQKPKNFSNIFQNKKRKIHHSQSRLTNTSTNLSANGLTTLSQPEAGTSQIEQQSKETSIRSAIIPNPYRQEFIDHKSLITEKLTLFLSQVLHSIVPDSDLNEILKLHKIRENLGMLLTDILSSKSNNDLSTC